MRNIYSLLFTVGSLCATTISAAQTTVPEPVYKNTFNTEDERAACTIVGAGEYKEEDSDANKGTYFQNNPVGGSIPTHVLPAFT